MIRLKRGHRIAGAFLFLLYLCGLSYFLFFSEALGRGEHTTYRYNLELFKEMKRFWNYREVLGQKVFLLNTFGNVAAFFPFGFFIPVIGGKKYDFFRILCFGFLFSGGIELIQLVTKLGSFDVDDIFLNTAGAVFGYCSFRFFFRRL